MQRNYSPYRVEAVDRALTLVSMLARGGSISVTEAAAELGVAPSTAHRLLSTLLDRRFAFQVKGRRYTAGPALLAAREALRGPGAGELLRPYLERIFELVGETAHTMVRTGTWVRFADGLESEQSLRVGLRTGARMPAHATSGGKAMLAELGHEELAELYRQGIEPWEGTSVTDLTQLHTQLAHVREQRFGLNEDESEPGVTAIGVSVGRIAGEHAALTVALPTSRFTTVAATKLRDVLIHVSAGARGLRPEPG